VRCEKHRLIFRIALVVSALCALSAIAFGQAQPSPTYALTHAKIFTLVGNTIEDGTVVLHDGKIAAVAPRWSSCGGAGDRRKGLQVYPGIFDSITQMGLREIGRG